METAIPASESMRVSISEKLDPSSTSWTIELIVLPIENVESPSTTAKLPAVHRDADLERGKMFVDAMGGTWRSSNLCLSTESHAVE